MASMQWFILAILGLVALVGLSRRHIRYQIIKKLLAEGKNTNEIANILKAYNESFKED